ncbi:MAG TPA: hypothetical protein VNO70_19075 [Blastocatellia bacterium]|nr:hypothetical protein [Blastocatellia bacterium]
MKALKAKVIVSTLEADGRELENAINQFLATEAIEIEDLRMTTAQTSTTDKVVCVILYKERQKKEASHSHPIRFSERSRWDLE